MLIQYKDALSLFHQTEPDSDTTVWESKEVRVKHNGVNAPGPQKTFTPHIHPKP
jgi:hypothetical protein